MPNRSFYLQKKLENGIIYHFLIFHNFMSSSQKGINSLEEQYISRDKKMKTNGMIDKINIMLGLLLVLCSMVAISTAQNEIPQAIVFENANMEGEHKHFFASDPDLTEGSDGRYWDDKISSIVVISGNWTFFENPLGSGDVPNRSVTLGPGVYPDVTRERIEDNSISQVRLDS